MSARIPSQLRAMREEWKGNPRLRWGTIAAAAIAFIYLCLVLVDWRRDLHAHYQERSLHLYKMTALAGQEYWVARAQSAQAVEKALQAEIPAAATIGLAQAEVQAMVRKLMNAYGRKLTTEARPPTELAGQRGLWRIPVTMRGVTSQAQMLEILRLLESSDRLVTIEQFSFTFAQGVPNFSLTLVAYYRVGKLGVQGAANGAA